MTFVLPTVDDVVLDVLGVPVVAEVSVHLDLHQEVPDGGGRQLAGSGANPHSASYQEEQVPEPEDGKHLSHIISGESGGQVVPCH